MTLILHCGARQVEPEELEAVPMPDPTATWMPIAHQALLDTVETELLRCSFTIDRRELGLSADNNRFFGTLDLSNGAKMLGYKLAIGVRNSHDQTFPAAIAVGARVFVCDNLSFSAEIVLRRKHTTYIMRDLPGLVEQAVGRIIELREVQETRFTRYRETGIGDAQAHDVICRSILGQVVSNQMAGKVLQAWHKPAHEEFQPRNLWSLHNAFTGEMGMLDPQGLPRRCQALLPILDSAC